LQGFFVFGILAGFCPYNSVLCLALIGYVSGDAEKRSVRDALGLTIPFGVGTMLVIVPLGGITAYLGKSIVLFDRAAAYVIGGIILLLMSLQFFGAYHLAVKAVFKRVRLPASFTPFGTFLLGLSFGAITIGRVAPMLFSVLAIAALSGSVGYGLPSHSYLALA
jgi:cytochrome c biogenesis protein CcdA